MTRLPLLLWDVDGTLLDAHGQARAAWEAAFESIWGPSHALQAVNLRGATDSGVMQALLAHYDIPEDRNRHLRFKAAYRRQLLHNLGQYPPTPIPGIQDLLSQLARGSWVNVLATGNYYLGARYKLSFADLRHHFWGGAFAEAALTRKALLTQAIARTRRRRPKASGPAIIVGDTEKDVQAAHALGLRCLGVAALPDSEAGLADAGADAIIPNFWNRAQITEVLRDWIKTTPVAPRPDSLGPRR